MQKIFSNPPALVKYLLLVLAAILDVLAVGRFLQISANPELIITYAFYSFLMFIEAALILICAFWIKKHPRIYWLAVILLALNIISIIFNQIGIVDILFAVFNGIILFVLWSNRKEFIFPSMQEKE